MLETLMGGARPASRLPQWLTALLTVGLLASPVLPVVAADQDFVSPGVMRAWARTERPVVEGRVGRPWLWGPAPLARQLEPYEDGGRDGQRLVQYFDKGRFELTYADQPEATDLALLQSGMLVRDLTLGLVQVGSNRVQVFDPVFMPVAGDDGPGENAEAPRYADFAPEVILGLARGAGVSPVPSLVGQPITATIQAGVRDSRPAEAEPRAVIGAYDPTSGHTIAAPFWEAFNAAGLVVDPISGADQLASLYDWRLLVGAPLTEPAWTTVTLGGRPTLLLVQLFERRVLTYRPEAPAGWQVEFGNSGGHAWHWRYDPAPVIVPAVGIAPAVRGRATQRLSAPPVTPTTPFTVDRSIPPSQHGEVTPGVGPGGVRHLMLARGFRTVDFINDNVGVWLTTPSGRAVSLNNDPRGPVRIVDETSDGVILATDTSQLGVGRWALTLESYSRPTRRSVLYFRVTTEPREVPLALVLDPLFWLGLVSLGPSAVLGDAGGMDGRDEAEGISPGAPPPGR